MENYLKYFGLSANYTKNELKIAYIKKIESITNLNISDIDKYFFIKQTKKIYKNIKNNFNKLFDINTMSSMSSMNSNNRTFSSYSNFNSNFRSYSEKLNDDNTKTIVETIKTNKNGVEEKTTNTYKKYPDGKIEKINSKLLK